VVDKDDYTRALESWSTLHRKTNRATGVYREVVEFWDGTCFESTAALRDHH
jgi:hypothetical protein